MVLVIKKWSRSVSANYMPISLLSAVRKFFERIIVDFIIRHLKDNALLSDN